MTTYSGITIDTVASDNFVNATEAGPAGLTLMGAGSFSDGAPLEGAVVTVTLEIDAYYSQTFQASISNVNVAGGTFSWSLIDTNLSSAMVYASEGNHNFEVASFGGATFTSPTWGNANFFYDIVPPTITAPPSITDDATNGNSNGAGKYVFNAGVLTVADDPTGTDLARLTIATQYGTFTLGNTAGIAIVGGADGTSSVTIAGDASAINAALVGSTYYNPSQDAQSGNVDDTLTLTAIDGAGNVTTSTVNVDVVCFYPGTLIGTPAGEVKVEGLKRGDLVSTSDGRAVRVCWVGRQTVSTIFANKLRVLPIRIKAGALADGLPVRDLLVSPDHALFVHGILIHAGALVNGTSVVRETGTPAVFTYYHVETEDHALILAEGVAAETFIDNIDRLGFDNWDEYEALYPQGKTVAELPYPRAKSHRQVPVAVRLALGARALAVGAKAAA